MEEEIKSKEAHAQCVIDEFLHHVRTGDKAEAVRVFRRSHTKNLNGIFHGKEDEFIIDGRL